jgi:hypothetical protein
VVVVAGDLSKPEEDILQAIKDNDTRLFRGRLLPYSNSEITRMRFM